MSASQASLPGCASSFALSLLLVAVGACTTWRTQEGAPSQVLAARQPASIRVTRADGTAIVVHAPRIAGDTLAGWPSGGEHASGSGHSSDSPHSSGHAEPLHIPLANTRSVAVRKVSAGKTVLLIAGVGVTAALVAAAAADACAGAGGAVAGGELWRPLRGVDDQNSVSWAMGAKVRRWWRVGPWARSPS
jgi:hypothetical protein